MLALSTSGCSRQFWRHQADKDAYEAITQKLNDPRWAVARIDITPSYESRFFDGNDPDFAPLPPDDPSAHAFMHWVDGWEGYKGWHKFGDEMSVENPQWLSRFGFRDDLKDPLTGRPMPPTVAIENLTLSDAVELSLIHSRDYQTNLEDVYLDALAVTFQRFQFNVRYLGIGGGEPNGSVSNRFTPGGAGSTTMGGRFGVRQVLPAGTQIAMDVANNTIWLFSGGNQTQTASVLSYSITQPLLIGAGRKVGLENLTASERALLYQVRTLARFRQQFFTNVVGTGNGGYLGLLQQLQSIRNEEGNIRRLEYQTERLLEDAGKNRQFANAELETLPPGLEFPPEISRNLKFYPDLKRLRWSSGLMTDEQEQILRNLSPDPAFQNAVNQIVQSLRTEVVPLDVLNLQTTMASSVQRLRSFRQRYQDALDSFKLLLGLPPDMVLSIDEEMLKPFQLISPELTALEDESNLFARVRGAIDSDDPPIEELRTLLTLFGQLIERGDRDGLSQVRQDLQRLEEITPRRVASFENETDLRNFKLDSSRAVYLFEEAEAKLQEIRRTHAGFVESLRSNDIDLEERSSVHRGMGLLQQDLLKLMQNLEVVQVSARLELIDTVPVDVSMEDATAQSVENRVDLMNIRAQVMDARRQVEIAANRLQAAINLVVDGDIRTAGGNRPFNFNGRSSQLRVGMQFTAPLDQITERNNYRTALITYQRARRTYMQTEDQTKQQVRSEWRQLYILKQNLETTRRAVRLAALQYDNAVNETYAPQQGAGVGGGGGGSRGLQGNNLTQALSSLLNNSNQLISNWLDYERNRLNLYRDMGTMEIGPDGLWNDPLYRKMNDASDDPAQIRLQSPSDDSDGIAPSGDWGSGLGSLYQPGVTRLDGALE